MLLKKSLTVWTADGFPLFPGLSLLWRVAAVFVAMKAMATTPGMSRLDKDSSSQRGSAHPGALKAVLRSLLGAVSVHLGQSSPGRGQPPCCFGGCWLGCAHWGLWLKSSHCHGHHSCAVMLRQVLNRCCRCPNEPCSGEQVGCTLDLFHHVSSARFAVHRDCWPSILRLVPGGGGLTVVPLAVGVTLASCCRVCSLRRLHGVADLLQETQLVQLVTQAGAATVAEGIDPWPVTCVRRATVRAVLEFTPGFTRMQAMALLRHLLLLDACPAPLTVPPPMMGRAAFLTVGGGCCWEARGLPSLIWP